VAPREGDLRFDLVETRLHGVDVSRDFAVRGAQAIHVAFDLLFSLANPARRGGRRDAGVRHRAGREEGDAAEDRRAQPFAADLVQRQPTVSETMAYAA
jgi:hypothetical protein